LSQHALTFAAFQGFDDGRRIIDLARIGPSMPYTILAMRT
jgi:hypothetical protein